MWIGLWASSIKSRKMELLRTTSQPPSPMTPGPSWGARGGGRRCLPPPLPLVCSLLVGLAQVLLLQWRKCLRRIIVIGFQRKSDTQIYTLTASQPSHTHSLTTFTHTASQPYNLHTHSLTTFTLTASQPSHSQPHNLHTHSLTTFTLTQPGHSRTHPHSLDTHTACNLHTLTHTQTPSLTTYTHSQPPAPTLIISYW